jgi:hypothetical protein
VALCTAGICLDVIGLNYSLISFDAMMKIVERFPRLEMNADDALLLSHRKGEAGNDLRQLRPRFR